MNVTDPDALSDEEYYSLAACMEQIRQKEAEATNKS